jgi:hypothetical protein
MIQKKQKEPVLSEEMQKIFSRSLGEFKDASVPTSEIYRLKYRIMELLTSNQDLLNALHHPEHRYEGEPLDGDVFRNNGIYDHMKLPNLKTNIYNSVCFEVDEIRYEGSPTFEIRFRTVSHENDCVTDYGVNRQDLLAAIIVHDFDWSNTLGFQLEKYSDIGAITDDDYYYREVVYLQRSANSAWNRVNRNVSTT